MKYYVKYSGYMEVDADDEEEAVQIAAEALLDLDLIPYTEEEWKGVQHEDI